MPSSQAGSLTRVEKDGKEVTLYYYDEESRLVQVTDPVGLVKPGNADNGGDVVKRQAVWNHLLPYFITLGAALLAVLPHRLQTFNPAYPPNTVAAFLTAITMFLNAAFYLAGPIAVYWDTQGANAHTRTLLLAGGVLTGCLIFFVWLYPLFWLPALYGSYRWHRLAARHSWQRLTLLGRSLMIAFVLTPAVVVWNLA